MAYNDAELRFQASLDDNITPNLQKLEKQLKSMGASESQVKMVLKAVDEATPRIKEVQSQIEKLPKEHKIQVKMEKDRYMQDMQQLRREADKPIKLNFVTNLKEKMEELFTMRSRVPIMPMAGAVPGANMLYAGGAASIPTAVAGGALGGLAQGVQANMEREQALVTLTQTLKDNTRAQMEIKDVAKFAMKSPFGFQEALQGDVRLRSYQMPTMQGGPGGQGWMNAAGNMAAAMGTPFNQAVEAVADARQGYFVRMMSYGIRMMREDFEKGGKYAGLSYEQGVERAIKRFEGSMEMQSETFKGVMSNLKDIATEKILIPAAQPAFNVLREKAVGLQDRLLNDPSSLDKLSQMIEKLQRGMYDFVETARRGRAYFSDYIIKPLGEVSAIVASLAGEFAQTFGGTLLTTLKAGSQLLYGMIKPVSDLMASQGPIGDMLRDSLQMYGTLKALTMLPFGDVFKPLERVVRGDMSPGNAITALLTLPKALAVGGFLLALKGIAEAGDAARQLERQFSDIKNTRPFEETVDDVKAMAHGMGQTTAEMQKLVALAAQGLPDDFKGDRLSTAVSLGRKGAALNRDFDIDPREAIRMMQNELKRRNDFSESAQRMAANQVRNLGAAAEELEFSFRDMTRIMQMFGKEASGVGLGTLGGAPFLAAMSKSMPDATLRSALTGYGSPSIDMLRDMSAGESNIRMQRRGPRFASTLPFWQWGDMNGGRLAESRRFYGDIEGRYDLNDQAAQETGARLRGIAPHATIPALPNPYREQDMGVDFRRIRQGGTAPERARRTMEELDKQTGFIDTQSKSIANLNTQLTEWTNWQTTLSQGADSLNLQLQKMQRQLLPFTQAIERQGYAMAQYAFDNIRPLERELQRLGNANLKLSNSMRVAQYDMGKYTEGLLLGEQAVQDQLYSLERYNKQLQLMQLTYSSIGAQLGQTTYDQGASVRVEPLSQINLAMQAERLQRKQQREQLKYELTYGDQRHQMEQAGRTRFQRQEMSFEDRMSGIRRSVGTIDEVGLAQERLARKQGRIQEAMIPFTETMADMQDKMTRMQLRVQKVSTSPHWQQLQTELADIGLQNAEAGLKVNYFNQAIAKQEAVMDDVKDSAQRLKDDLVSMMIFDDTDPQGVAKRLIEQAHTAGTITDKQRKDALTNIKKVADSITTVRQQAVRTDEKWTSIITEGVKGALGDTWRSLGARISKLGGGMGDVGNIIGNVGPIAAPLGGGLVGAGIAGLAFRRMMWGAAGFAADTTAGSVAIARQAARGRERALTRAERAPEGSRRQRFWFNRASTLDDFARAPGAAIARRMSEGSFRQQFNLLRRGILAVGTPLATAGGFAMGGPGGAIGMRRAFTRFFEDRSVREAFKDIATGGRKVAEAAEDLKKTPANVKSSFKDVADEIGKEAKKIRLRGLGRFGKIGTMIAGAVATFEVAVNHIRDLFPGKVPKVPKVPSNLAGEAARGAEAAGAESNAMTKASEAVSQGRFSKALKFLGRAGLVTGAGFAGAQAAQGHFGAAADTASYLLPYIGPTRMASDFGNWLNKRDDKRWENASDAERWKIDPQRMRVEQARRADAKLGQQQIIAHPIGGAGGEGLSDNQFIKLAREQAESIDMTLAKARKVYKRGGELPRTLEDYFYRVEDLQKGSLKKQLDDTERHGVKLVNAVEDKHKRANDKEEKGYSRINRTTDSWLDKINKRINHFKRNLGLTGGGGGGFNDSVNDSPGSDAAQRAGGGFTGKVLKGMGDGKGRLYWAGEEDDELVIPLAGHRRDRAKNLVRQAAGIIGMAGGGLSSGVDPAYVVARREYHMARAMASGGQIGAAGNMIVPIPGFPGESIHRSVLPQLLGLIRRFRLSVSDGFATSGHANNSDHYWGGAVDLVPGAGGSWDLIDQLAHWAEPKQNQPRFPFRWVGYDGDSGHGRGNHLHLSWRRDALGKDALRSLSNLGILGGVRLPHAPKELGASGIIGRTTLSALRKLRKLASTSDPLTGDFSGIKGGGNSAANIALGRRMAAAMGWTGGDWTALRQLWMGESGWRTDADNPTSDAFGIPQAMTNLHKLPSGYLAGDAKAQIGWGLNYIKGKYGDPTNALRMWNSRSPHWYAAGKKRIENDEELAVLHRGERVLNPAEAGDSTYIRKARESQDESLKMLKGIYGILFETNDRDKKRSHVNLADINSRLRGNWVRGRTGLGDGSRLGRRLRGGEGVAALVKSETARAKRIADAYDKTPQGRRDTRRVRRARNLLRSAKSLVRTAKTPRQRRLAKRAVRVSKRAVRSTVRSRALGRARRYVKGAARRGINRRIVEKATGRRLSPRSRKAYERAARAAPGSKAQTRALAKLERVLTRELRQARKQAGSDSKAARKAVRDAAHAQGKRISASGKLISKHTREGHRRGAKATGKAADKVGKHVKHHGEKATKATKDVHDETKKGKEHNQKADDHRTKAEQHADKRERQHYNRMERFMETLVRKDISVNIHNEAHGATLSSTVDGGRRRRQ